jgi:hypothetical protein
MDLLPLNLQGRPSLRGVVLVTSELPCFAYHLGASEAHNTTRLTFTSGPVAGKKMIVQTTNTGGDLGQNHFDIAMPGGGGAYNSFILSRHPRANSPQWAYSTHVPANGVLLLKAGDSSTAASRRAHSVMDFLRSSRLVATGDSTGSRTQIIQMSRSRLLHAHRL